MAEILAEIPSSNIPEWLNIKTVAIRYSCSPCSIWRWTRECGFPSPVRIGSQAVRWKLADLIKWEADKARAGFRPVSRPPSPGRPPKAATSPTPTTTTAKKPAKAGKAKVRG